jgi:hypothetical protein
MLQIQTIGRCAADLPDGSTVGATTITIILPDPEAADLIAATTESASTPLAADSRAVARPIGLALQAAVADGSLVLPS